MIFSNALERGACEDRYPEHAAFVTKLATK
jgi:hypothetical protein